MIWWLIIILIEIALAIFGVGLFFVIKKMIKEEDLTVFFPISILILLIALMIVFILPFLIT